MGGTVVRARPGPLQDARFRSLLWAIVGGAGWIGIAVLAAQLFAERPPKAGFDLELLLSAGRRVASGLSPYGPMPATLQGEDLFYSYPPPIAQALSLVAAVPSGIVFALWGAGSALGLVYASRSIVRRLRPGSAAANEVVLAVTAIAPYIFPFSVAILFGNLDAWFPLVFGLVLLAALEEASGTPAAAPRVVGGVALGLVAIGKLHPAPIVLWFLVRAIRRPQHRLTLAAIAAAALAVLAVSLVTGGLEPWFRYADVLRAASGADIVSRLNIGPASQLALLTGNADLVRPVEIVTAIAVLGVTAWSAAAIRDPVLALGVAVTASLVTLPVTWYHYPAALLPFVVAALVRRSPANGRVVLLGASGAIVASFVALLAPVLSWIAVAFGIYAVARSRE